MKKLSPSLLALTLAALIGLVAAGCRPNSTETGAKDFAKDSAAKEAAKANQAVAALPAQPAPAPQPAPAFAPPAPPPAPVQRMTSAQEADFNSWVARTYLGCWKQAPQPSDSDPYVARVRLAFKPDGSLARTPKLVNPPSDPALKSQAKSVMQAVQACNPLQVPAQYRPFYEQWKNKTVQFNPQLAAR